MHTYRGCLRLSCLRGEEGGTVIGDGSGGGDRFCYDICENAVVLDSPADYVLSWRSGGERLVVGRKN